MSGVYGPRSALPPDPLGRLVGVAGSWGALLWAVGQGAGGAAVHELRAQRGGAPCAFSGPDASGCMWGDKCWPGLAPSQALPAAPSPVGHAARPVGTAQHSLLRAVLCALISQVRGWTGPWPAQPAITCDSCCPVCRLPRSLWSINGACGSAAAEPSGQQTALLHAPLASPAAQDLDRRQDQVRGRLPAVGPRPHFRSPSRWPRRRLAAPPPGPSRCRRRDSWFLFPMHILL